MMTHSINGTFHQTIYDNGTLFEEQLLEHYGMWIHPHWYQYLDYIDSMNEILFNGLAVYMTLVCLIGGTASVIVLFITIR